MSLHRTLTTENIMACCKTCRIWPFDDTNMNSKMGPSENYAWNYAHESLKSINVRVKEIEEETLLLRFPEERLSTSHCFVELDGEGEEEGGDTSPPWHSTHVWVHDGDEDIIPSTQCKNLDVNPPIGVLSISRFLALPNHKEVTSLLLKPTCKQKKNYFFQVASPKWVRNLSTFSLWVAIHGIYYIVKNDNHLWCFKKKHIVSN